MINVEAEVSKHKNTKDRDMLGSTIRDYKNLALSSAGDIVLAGQYNLVALKLQEIYDKMPAPRMKSMPARTPGAQTKTATTSREEKSKINAAWNKRVTSPPKGKK